MFSSSSSDLFTHLRIPHRDIVNATNHFSDANLIRGNNIRKEYKGQLLHSGQLIDVVVRRQRFKRMQKDAYREHWMEVSMLSKLNHKNIVSIVGCCDENMEMIVVNKHEAIGSLDNFLRDPTLTWMRRLQICVGIARALSFIYYDPGRDFSVIHRDIKSFNILLGDNWEAKLSGFEHSMNQTAARRNHLFLTDVCGTEGYIDPTYIKSGSVTHKSDIYSFGVVLFEVLCGKEAASMADDVEDPDRYLLASSVRSEYEGGRLEEMIDPGLWKQMNTKSFKLFSETAYHCLNEQRQQRPNIDQIIIKLEQALESQRKYEYSLMLKAYSMVDRTTTKTLKGKDLKHLEISLIDIEIATENFAKTYLIGSGTYGEVYKAELDHFDIEKFFQLEEKSVELPKKRSIVAIKRIKNREDQQGEKGFLAEIEMLTNCNHPNVVSLHGFCEEGDHMILVYEYASKGSLNDYLGITDNLTNLSWVQRIKICIDIARGLNYLHTKIEDERRIIHRDIKSDNILLTENWQAKIADFGLSKFRPENQQLNNTLYTKHIAGTELYLDPEYYKTGKLKNESDIYSLGVVLFEILSGRFANDPLYTKENSNGIAAVARRCFNEGTIREMVDPKLMEETHEYIFTLNRGPHKDSLDVFSKIAYQCVSESQAQRPPAQVVIKKLEEALYFQENPKDHLLFSLEDIKSATDNFSNSNFISEGRFGKVYRGEVTNENVSYTIVAKRMHKKLGGGGQGEAEFLTELQMLLEYKHENIIGLVGYCNQMDERIIVYEYASRGSLDKHLSNNDLTWRKRLQICIDVASGLDFLHGGSLTQDVVIHRDIKTANVLLGHDWKAKITDFGHSLISPINKDIDFVIDNPEGNGTKGYVDPLYHESGFLTQESDIYSLGVVLFEILCGTLVFNNMFADTNLFRFLTSNKGKLNEVVFEGIKDQIAPNSLTTFLSIALQCLHNKREERPTTSVVLLQLKKALEFQEDYEIWEPKLPKDYKEIFQMSNSSDIYYSQRERDLYNMLCNGILLQQGKMLFRLERNGKRNVMTSAKTFSYINRCRHKWQSAPESRFEVVAEMLDILNLKIKIKTKPQLLSPNVVYGVYLIFKFCDQRKISSKPVYVNLKYKYGSRSTSHAYFVTWRDNKWMMIELCRFLNNKEDIVFNFLLESLSGYYCGNTTIYIEGIDFRPFDNVKHGEMKGLKETQQLSIDSEDILKTSQHNVDGEKLFLLSEINGKKHLMLSAKAALYDHFNVKDFDTKPSAQSRFPEVIELLRQQVFRINCKIKSEMLSPDTEYACYLVFKLSEKCRGLHCPVKVRDLLHRNNKEVEIIYFRSPSPWNLHHTNQAPQERVDGCMEVKVWKCNPNHQLIKNDCFRVNLKLISYEGTMAGLIVCGLEFRPM